MAMLKYSLLFALLIVVVQMQDSTACLQQERMALLQIKAFFLSNYRHNTFLDPLAYWKGVDCCVWERVRCNITTKHVVVLTLDELLHSVPFSNQGYFFNASLLQPFQELRSLNLTSNNFLGLIEPGGFSSLKKLEILNLSHNHFNNDIISLLSGLPSLKKLYLRDNNLKGSLPTREFAKMRNLESLDLFKNQYYDGVIPLQEMRNLKFLMIAGNAFNGTIPIQGLCERNDLIFLDISGNYITGEFPLCLTNWTALRALDMSFNQFSGRIPPTISNLTSLEYLSLAKNNFEGSFSLSNIANLTKLKFFQLSSRSNPTKLLVETENPPWIPTFQLNTLTLLNCALNNESSSKIPTFLLSQYELISVNLAYNHLVGTFPSWLLQNNSYLQFLYLRENFLSGTLQLPTSKLGLFFLDISRNNLSGQLPNNMGFLLPQVFYLNMSRNSFEGNLPLSVKEMRDLMMLDLSNNKFNGNLRISMFNDFRFLACLLLESNNFSGSFESDELTNTPSLVALDISQNKMVGKVPSWIGSLENLQYLQISENHFEGELPFQICSLQKLVFLDVSKNQLFGHIPSCFNLSTLSYLYMQENHLLGPIPHALSRSSRLKVLDLSNNELSGKIPNWLNEFAILRVLLLKGNQLDGPIPQQLCQARDVNILDFSSNKLNGSIPSCLSNMSFGMVSDGKKYSTVQKGEGYLASLIQEYLMYFDPTEDFIDPQGQAKVDFTTKRRSDTYEGNILNYMSGLDLSHNELTGTIPPQIGELLQIHALNFSHNKLEGGIPMTISNLKQLESLDLSYNLLSGKIPSQLGEINSLAIFNVSYNNLSGMIPTSPQFQTFSDNSYFGNSYLCGEFIEKKCSNPTTLSNNQFVEPEEDGRMIDMEALYWSFGVSYVIALLGIAIIFYINPQWREAWFYFAHLHCPYVVGKYF